MTPLANFSLKHKNTFGFNVSAEHFLATHCEQSLREALQWAKQHCKPVFFLGGGSNLVLTRDITGLTVQQMNATISVEQETADSALIHATAGTGWHELVLFCVEHGFYGIENLSLIPGSVGAAPIQNIGAYGVELADVLESIEVISLDDLVSKTVSPSECEFGYRYSRFKGDWRNRLVITGIKLRLSKKRGFNLSYAALAEALANVHSDDLTIRQVSETVCSIRSAKLPDPAELGNAGSFFKNPEISLKQLQELRKLHPKLPAHKLVSGNFKIPAAWLVDRSGWKGKCLRGVGVHKHQAIVLVNYGEGTGKDVLSLATAIQEDIASRYSVRLEFEPLVV